MPEQHPITPPPELVEEWRNLPEYVSQLRTMSTVTITTEKLQDIATQAARWGADQELEACCDFLQELLAPSEWITGLRTTRRLKQPSVKDKALKALRSIERGLGRPEDTETIRRALEALDD